MGKTSLQANKTQESHDVLDRVRNLLKQGKPQEALDVINSAGLATQPADNLRGVCLLRMGMIDQAAKVFHRLVFRSNVGMTPDIPPAYKINYATSLLLAGNLPGCNTVLNEVYDKKHPGLAQLRQAVGKWKRSLPLLQRLTLLVGVQPAKPVTLDFPPGVEE